MKIAVTCGNGMGSSQIMKGKAKEVFEKLDIDVDIDHMSVGEAKASASSYDVIFCSESLVSNFNVDDSETEVIGLVNLLSADEMEEKVQERLDL